MKLLYKEIFLESGELKEMGTIYPVKLEYYITYQKAEDSNDILFGVEIVKKEYINNGTNVETKRMENISAQGLEIYTLISMLAQYHVTPVSLKDIIEDFQFVR